MVGAGTIARPGAWVIGELTIRASGRTAIIEGPDGHSAPIIDYEQSVLREMVRFDQQGRYRPLPGARTLKRGWRVRCDVGEVEEAIETIYPLALVHRREWERGALRIVSLDEVFARQQGRYRVAAELDVAGRERAREVLCGRCVKTPVWSGTGESGQSPIWIPCPEPCSVLLSLCREAALWEKGPPAATAVDRTVAFAAFEEPGNEIREAYLEGL